MYSLQGPMVTLIFMMQLLLTRSSCTEKDAATGKYFFVDENGINVL